MSANDKVLRDALRKLEDAREAHEEAQQLERWALGFMVTTAGCSGAGGLFFVLSLPVIGVALLILAGWSLMALMVFAIANADEPGPKATARVLKRAERAYEDAAWRSL